MGVHTGAFPVVWRNSKMMTQLSKFTAVALWAIALGLLAVAISYALFCSPREEFLDNVMSGLLATAGGLIGGIPVALLIDRTIKRGEEKSRALEERNREIELLKLLKQELLFTNSLLQLRRANPINFRVHPLKSNLWVAVSSAGTLNLISDYNVLDRIVAAYHLINVVRGIEKQGYKASRSANVTLHDGKTVTQTLWEDAGNATLSCMPTSEKLLSTSMLICHEEPNYHHS